MIASGIARRAASVIKRGFHVRQATPADAAELCALFAEVNMEGDVVLSVRRDPDFDSLYRLQSPLWETWVAELNGRIEAMGTILVRDGYVGGERRRVGYLGDLRLSRRLRGQMVLDRVYGPLLQGASERFGCDVFLTAIIASNARALRALTVTNARTAARGRPLYTPLMDFDIRSLHLLRVPRQRAGPNGVVVRRGQPVDVPRIARLLDEDGQGRPFGYPMREEDLRRRLTSWPGLVPESFYVAERSDGDLAGVVALWDAAPVKRMVVTEYRGAMRRVRMVYDVAATLLRQPRLPSAGERFQYTYVTHQAVRDDDPAVLRALLTVAARDRRRSNQHFISICAPRESGVDIATRGFVATNLAARLFVVTLPGRRIDPIWFSARPGFEMALV